MCACVPYRTCNNELLWEDSSCVHVCVCVTACVRACVCILPVLISPYGYTVHVCVCVCVCECVRVSYLYEGALLRTQLMHGSQRDPHDGHQGDEPAQHLGPGRVSVRLPVACRGVLNHTRDQDALQREGGARVVKNRAQTQREILRLGSVPRALGLMSLL